jgi:S-DNA-T family DNA segregation ATPase FtsK/SpoIIIE
MEYLCHRMHGRRGRLSCNGYPHNFTVSLRSIIGRSTAGLTGPRPGSPAHGLSPPLPIPPQTLAGAAQESRWQAAAATALKRRLAGAARADAAAAAAVGAAAAASTTTAAVAAAVAANPLPQRRASAVAAAAPAPARAPGAAIATVATATKDDASSMRETYAEVSGL